jgi:hypothetical protein
MMMWVERDALEVAGLGQSRLIDTCIWLEGGPGEPEVIDRHQRGELFPSQLPANRLTQHIPFAAGLAVDDPLAIAHEG